MTCKEHRTVELGGMRCQERRFVALRAQQEEGRRLGIVAGEGWPVYR